MSERDPRSLALSPVGEAARPEPRSDEEGRGLWSQIDDRLRGRWRPAIALGLFLGALFAAAGYVLTTPKYESTGLIRIAPNISPVLRDTPETGLLPLYQSFVQTQVRLLTSRPVLDKALRNETLAAQAWARQPGAIRVLEDGLDVQADRLSELIAVRFDADFPDVAQSAVNAVIDAYDELYASVGSADIARKLTTLRNRHSQLSRERVGKREAIDKRVSASEFGVSDLRALLSAKVLRLEPLESTISQLERSLESTPPDSSDAAEDAGFDLPAPSSQELAALDPQLATLLQTRDDLRFRFEVIKNRNRPGSDAYLRLEEELRTAERMVADREIVARAAWEPSVPRDSLSPGVVAPVSASELEQLKAMAADGREQIRSMSELQFYIEEKQAEIDDIDFNLAEIDARIKYLNMEMESIRTGRITIVARGDRPYEPSQDRRRKLAAVGAVGGLGLGFGIFFFIGGVDRRAYGSAQLRDQRGLRCLGVLPELGSRRLGDESDLVAAHCVHQIRNHIEAVRKPGTSLVLCVTSPYQGDGKTSLAMALGWSYAAADNRTVLVDCDLTGQDLTRQAGMGDRLGLREMLRHGLTNGQTTHTVTKNLDLVPVGLDPDFGAEVLRRRDLETVLGRLRQNHDVVIVDTGPIPGSLEGVPAAAAADHVLLAVRRGRRTPRLEESIEKLECVGASCLGVVLNGAASSECDRYVRYASRSGALHDREADEPARSGGRGDLGDRIGAGGNLLERAMKTAASHSDEDEEQREQANQGRNKT